jgi:hypothetical protein
MVRLIMILNGLFESFDPVKIDNGEPAFREGTTIPSDHGNQFLPNLRRCAGYVFVQIAKEEEVAWC